MTTALAQAEAEAGGPLAANRPAMPPVGPPGGGDRDLPPGGARAEKRYLRRARHGAAGRTRTGWRVRQSQDPSPDRPADGRRAPRQAAGFAV